MLSYVLLISIVVAIAISIYSWLEIIANVEPIKECEESTSLIISDYACYENIFKLTLKNSGRFNIDGFIFTVTDNPDRVPITPLNALNDLSGNTIPGRYIFKQPLNPGDSAEALFDSSNTNFTLIRNVRIQPFIILEYGDEIVCENAIIVQSTDNCEINTSL